MTQNTIERPISLDSEVAADFSRTQIPNPSVNLDDERRLNSKPSSAFLDENKHFEDKKFIAPVRTQPSRDIAREIQASKDIAAEQLVKSAPVEEPGFWGGLWDGFTSTVSTVYKAVKNIPAVVGSIVSAIPTVLEACKDGVVWMCNNPEKVINGLKIAGSFIIDGVKDAAVAVWNDPIGALGKTWEFAKSLSESIGLTDILRGGRSLLEGIGYSVIGDFENAGKSFKNSLVAVKGAFTGFCEFTGLADVGRCIVALANNNPQEALLYFGMAAWGIAGIFLTAGAANAAKVGTQILVREVGETCLKIGAEKITREALLEAGEKIAKDSLEKLGNKYAFRVTEKAVSGTVKPIAKKETVELLTKAGMPEVIEQSTTKLLKYVSKVSRNDLAQELQEQGLKKLAGELNRLGLRELAEKLPTLGVKEIKQELKQLSAQGLPNKLVKQLEQFALSDAEAKYTAKSMKKILKNREHDPILKRAIINSITNDVKEDLMTRGLKEGFEKPFEKGMKEICEKHGFDPVKTDNLIKAGKEGFEEGVDAGVRKVVREAVQTAFRKFRDGHTVVELAVMAAKALRPAAVVAHAEAEKGKAEKETKNKTRSRAKRDIKVKGRNAGGEETLVDEEENSMV